MQVNMLFWADRHVRRTCVQTARAPATSSSVSILFPNITRPAIAHMCTLAWAGGVWVGVWVGGWVARCMGGWVVVVAAAACVFLCVCV